MLIIAQMPDGNPKSIFLMEHCDSSAYYGRCWMVVRYYC